MDEVLWFLGECWKDLGRPEQVQLDNARELAGWGPAARTLSRVIRLCLRFGVSPLFIPVGEPQFNGSVENFNGWFQEPLFQRRFRRPGDLRRELARLQEAVNTQVAVHQCFCSSLVGLCARTGTPANGQSSALRATVLGYLHSAQDDLLPLSWMSSPACRLQDVPVPLDLAPEPTTGVMVSARSSLG
jgi:hypothetical protein